MHSPNTLLKVIAQPYFRTKALPSSTLINTNQQFCIPSEGVDLMKGECTLRRVFVQAILRVIHSPPYKYYELLIKDSFDFIIKSI